MIWTLTTLGLVEEFFVTFCFLLKIKYNLYHMVYNVGMFTKCFF